MSLKTMPGWLGRPSQGWVGAGPTQGTPFSPTLQAHDAADNDDMAPAAPLHVGQHLLDQADEAEEVGVHEALHGRQALALQGSRHAHPGIADCGQGASVGCALGRGCPCFSECPQHGMSWCAGPLRAGCPWHRGSLVCGVMESFVHEGPLEVPSARMVPKMGHPEFGGSLVQRRS